MLAYIQGGGFEKMSRNDGKYLKNVIRIVKNRLDDHDDMMSTLKTIKRLLIKPKKKSPPSIGTTFLNFDILKLGALLLATSGVIALGGLSKSIMDAKNFLESSVVKQENEIYPKIKLRPVTTMRTSEGSRKRRRQIEELSFESLLENEILRQGKKFFMTIIPPSPTAKKASVKFEDDKSDDYQPSEKADNLEKKKEAPPLLKEKDERIQEAPTGVSLKPQEEKYEASEQVENLETKQETPPLLKDATIEEEMKKTTLVPEGVKQKITKEKTGVDGKLLALEELLTETGEKHKEEISTQQAGTSQFATPEQGALKSTYLKQDLTVNQFDQKLGNFTSTLNQQNEIKSEIELAMASNTIDKKSEIYRIQQLNDNLTALGSQFGLEVSSNRAFKKAKKNRRLSQQSSWI